VEVGKVDARRTANQQQKIGDLFYACMDENAVEKAGAAPIQGALDRIAALRSVAELPAFLAAQHLALYASSMFFNFGSNQDFADSLSIIAFADTGGLGLPDRDYYSKTDAKSEDLRQKYVTHMEKIFQLLGDLAADSAARAKAVLRFQ
jgi:putative endopeptidase